MEFEIQKFNDNTITILNISVTDDNSTTSRKYVSNFAVIHFGSVCNINYILLQIGLHTVDAIGNAFR